MGNEILRTYLIYNIEEVKQHLLIMGDLSADCGACRALGIAFSATQCPECGTPFKYASSRRLETHPGERFSWAGRTKNRRPDLVLIDYTDYAKVMGQKKARDFFA